MLVRNNDPVLRSAWREMLVVLGVWVVAAAWSIGVCYRYGYLRDAAEIRLILGFPDWIFWGIVVPWVACALLSWVISVFVMSDGDLGVDSADDEADDA